MKHYFIVAACVAGLFMSACATPQGPNEQTDTLIGVGGGALAGGLIGSAFGGSRGALLGVGLGALAGGFAGNQIGRSQDQDQAYRYREQRRYYQEDPQYARAQYYDRDYDRDDYRYYDREVYRY